MRRLAILLLVAPLAACVGESSETAFGFCEMEMLKLPPSTTERVAFKTTFLSNCMASRGFKVQFGTQLCPLMSSPAEREFCYEPTTVRNRVAKYLPVW